MRLVTNSGTAGNISKEDRYSKLFRRQTLRLSVQALLVLLSELTKPANAVCSISDLFVTHT